jgi:hypothetical protein
VVKTCVKAVALFIAQGLLGFEEVEGVGDDFGGVRVVADVDLTLDALFELAIESERAVYRSGWQEREWVARKESGLEREGGSCCEYPLIAWYLRRHPDQNSDAARKQDRSSSVFKTFSIYQIPLPGSVMSISIRLCCIVSLLASTAWSQTPRPQAPPTPPVAGIIQSFDGKVAAVKTSDLGDVQITVAPTATITLNAKRTLADIKPGDFIASGGTRGADGKIRANEIRIFSGARGEGQFPMAQPNQVMTNATVTEVMTNATVKQVGSVSGVPVIKLTFHGSGVPGAPACTGRAADAPDGPGKGCVGDTEFEVPANVPVVAQVPGDITMLKPGAKASFAVTIDADGKATATRVTISEQ